MMFVGIQTRADSSHNRLTVIDNDTIRIYQKSADFTLYFPVDNAELNGQYMGNSSPLRKMSHIIDSISGKPHMRFLGISLCGYSSPDGLESYNIRLSKQRMERIQRYLTEKYAFSPAIIHTSYVAENWQALDSLVNISNLPHRKEILEIIASPYNNDEKEARIRSRYGTEYRQLLDEFYPKLRYTTMHIDFEDSEKPEPKPQPVEEVPEVVPVVIPEPVPVVEPVVIDTVPAVPALPSVASVPSEPSPSPLDSLFCPEDYRPWFAVKTNVLYDLVLSPNLEVERWFGKNHQWSIMAEWMAPWYIWRHNSNAYEILNVGVELRYWFNAKDECHRWLTGWFAGIYGMSGKYDLEWKSKGYQGEYVTPGITLGYAHKIGHRWNLEYSLSAGWLNTHYRYYEGMFSDKHLIWQHNGHTSYWGPTKLKVSLVYFLGGKRYKEGGRR